VPLDPGRAATLSDVSGFDDLYRENILDHYKSPRNHGTIEDADASAEGMNPLCGDEVTITLAFGADGETIEDVRFAGRGCAISQASTSMLTELIKGRKAADVLEFEKEELLEEVGIPLTPIRLKCAILGLHTLKVALGKATGAAANVGDDDIDVR
jgi:nitrogen fixation NifU-like protein